LDNEDNAWKYDFLDTLHKANLKVITLPHILEKEDEENWGYLNFLQIKGLIKDRSDTLYIPIYFK